MIILNPLKSLTKWVTGIGFSGKQIGRWKARFNAWIIYIQNMYS